MAVPIKEYRQQTSPSSLGVTPVARGAHYDDSLSRAGANLAGAIGTAAGNYAQTQAAIAAEKQRQEVEDAKVWTASATATAQVDMMKSFADLQDSAESGAPNFTEQFSDLFEQYQEDTLANAPNDTSKKFLAESMVRLRADMTGRALAFETDERRKWRVETGKAAIDATASSMAADPARLPVALAEQRALIDSYDVPAEQKRALREYLDTQVSTAAVLGEIERNPAVAREQLARRLGVDATAVAGPGASADMVWQRMLDRETSGYDQGAVSRKGAVGVAQVMPETGPEAARYANLPWDPVRFRADADYNAALGRAYYDAQLRKYQEPALAAAAYNAGPGAVDEWIGKYGDPRKGEISVAAWAAKIPYKETREYVANVAAPGPSIAQATAEKPDGVATGSVAYDLLPVPNVVQLLGRVNQEMDKQSSQFRSYVSAREADDLAAYGDGKQPPAPLTSGEFVAAYGEVDGLRRWQSYQHAQQYATEVSGLATKTPAEIGATVRARAPVPGEGYASASKAHAALVQAAESVLKQRAEDPIAFAMSAGLSDAKPLDFQNVEAMGAELKTRIGVAETMNQKYGTGYTLLTKTEATQMSAMMGGMTAPEKAQFLQTVRGSLPDPRAYQSVMGQLRADSPVTATAGSIMFVGGQVTAGEGRLRAEVVAQRVLAGEDLLNPTSAAGKQDGKPKFPMPTDADLRTAWTNYTRDAYAGSPDTEAASYQAFRAFYAAELAAAGDFSGKFNEDVAEAAAAAVTGGVTDVNDSNVVMPWGVEPAYAIDQMRRSWESQREAAGLGGIPFEQIGLRTVGDGVYAVTAGTGPIRGADGQPMLLRVPRHWNSQTPQVPTGP